MTTRDPVPHLLIQEEFFGLDEVTLMCPCCSHLRRLTREWVRSHAGEVASCGECASRLRIPTLHEENL